MEEFYNDLGEPQQPELKRKTVNVKFIIGILVILAANFLATISNLIRLGGINSMKYDVPYSLGVLLAPIIISAIFCVLIFVASKNNRGRNLLIFSIIALISSFGNLSYQVSESIDEMQKEKVAMERIANMFRDIVSQKEIVKEDITKEKYGKYASILNIVQDTYFEKQDIMKEYDTVFSVMNDSSTYSKKTLSDLNKIKEKRHLFDKTSKNIEELGNKTNDLLQRFMSRLENIEVDNAMKADIKEGFKNSFSKSIENTYNNLENMDNVIKNMRNILAFLEKNHGSYTFEGEQLVFYKDSDVSAYNKLFVEYETAVDKINKNYEGFQNTVREKLIEMERIAK